VIQVIKQTNTKGSKPPETCKELKLKECYELYRKARRDCSFSIVKLRRRSFTSFAMIRHISYD